MGRSWADPGSLWGRSGVDLGSIWDLFGLWVGFGRQTRARFRPRPDGGCFFPAPRLQQNCPHCALGQKNMSKHTSDCRKGVLVCVSGSTTGPPSGPRRVRGVRAILTASRAQTEHSRAISTTREAQQAKFEASRRARQNNVDKTTRPAPRMRATSESAPIPAHWRRPQRRPSKVSIRGAGLGSMLGSIRGRSGGDAAPCVGVDPGSA